jgi:intraflagellar transport protein 172
MAWRTDGARLIIGSLTGGLELFDACIKRSRYKGVYEFTYVSLSQVIVKNLTSGSRIVLKSNVGFEIKRINIFKERYLVAHTPESLLLGDLTSCKLSEISWNSNSRMSLNASDHNDVDVAEKFYFDNPAVCLIYRVGELFVVEYGQNELVGSCRTEHMSP